MSDLKIPTIHLNVTSKEQLFEQICNAIDAVHAAGDIPRLHPGPCAFVAVDGAPNCMVFADVCGAGATRCPNLPRLYCPAA
jgi:hypothetical protein